ncbi:hypothetical protein IWQ60_004429 [Tieghemiomyces parasiticus]|uniref:HMG box domain-containing protein n=1 Tax=Tieghemiomyces parasiticus TaxID=78921 RepID=A0A9W8A8W3_9FUNG|nr:hypothetical protein IWQ60_004429 [Tieghemiomyces parasiticus]
MLHRFVTLAAPARRLAVQPRILAQAARAFQPASLLAFRGVATARSTTSVKKATTATGRTTKKTAGRKVKKVAKKAAPKLKKKRVVVAKKPNLRKRVVIPPPSRATAYGLYIKEVFERTPSTGSRDNFKLTVTQASKKWQAMSKSEQEAYNQRAQHVKAQNAEALRQFYAKTPYKLILEENKRRRALARKKNSTVPAGVRKPKAHLLHHPDAPPRPMSSYILYMKDMYQHPEIKELVGDEGVIAATRVLSSRWRALSAAGKQPYVDQAKKRAAEYTAANRTFLARQGITA